MTARSVAAALVALLCAGCGDDRGAAVVDGVLQTALPGHPTAGGRTSGQVIAASGAPTATQPAGTPGIPQGAGGTPGGTAMGGTTAAQAAAGPGGATHPAGDGLAAPRAGPAESGAAAVAAPPGTTTPGAPVVPPTAVPGIDLAQQQARSLAAAMDAVAQRWRTRAAAQGWAMHPPSPVEPLPGFHAEATQSAPAGQPQGRLTPGGAQAPIRSEKLGTAPLSADVKAPTKPPPDPGVGADAPDAAGR